ncbi:PWWP and/or PHD domain containing protein [Asbolus verrucosus]|uniref:PWWP and/or PHD domain containing protein n=1 Tax=Asbolus verrucosus TaxID=1661398 RepID=A0A482VXS6_ASBVE|nr:PWWP and/or PHD domain containing protein [Asbolus verrucosus]
MDPSKSQSTNTSEDVVSSSPEILSPGGKSRYGRTRRPKIAQDFYNIDSVIIDEKPPNRHSPLPIKLPKLKPRLKIGREIIFEIKDEFTKLDDLGMKVANNFKTNLQRGLDDTIKERKFFKSMPESKVEIPNVVDVTKVFKLISTKPAVISDVYEKKAPPKIINRSQPLYHVRFFGDKGRRSWVNSTRIMLYCGKDDLEKLAKVLKAEDKVKSSFIRESYVVKSSKLAKWQCGVDEAESLKSKTVEERLNYFFEVFASKREKMQRLSDLGIKEELPDAPVEVEAITKSKKRGRVGGNETQESITEKKLKKSSEEEARKKIKKTEETESLKKVKKSDNNEDSQKQESPKKSTKKLQLSDEKNEENRTPKKIARKPQSSEEIGGEKQSPKKIVRQSQSNEEIGEEIQSPKKTVKKLQLNDEQSSETRKKAVKKSQSNEEVDENQSLEIRKKVRNSQSKEELIEEVQGARKKLRNFQTKEDAEEKKKTKAKEDTVEETAEMSKKNKRNSTEENLQETEENEECSAPKVRNKRHLITSEYSNSDTDSKFSDNSSVPTSLESQAALYRRNNIFRGIPKEKVCQICEKPGEVFKCKGPCNGVYHYNCAMSTQTKDGAEEEKKSEKAKKEAEVEDGNSKNNVEIIAVNSKKPLPNLSTSPNFKGMTLAEKIDFRMKEIMKKFDYQSVYSESTDSSSEEFIMDESFEKLECRSTKVKNQSKLSLTITSKPSKKEVPIIKHVTADNINYICVTNERPKDKEVTELIKDTLKHLRCTWCSSGEISKCLVCNKEESKIGSKFRQKCSLHQCGKYYHPECLKVWPQTQWSLIHSTRDKKSDASYDTFVCPRHVCHTCISDDPRAANSRCPSDKVVKCLRCPATYHSSNYCVPAGTHILSSSQIICPRHYSRQKSAKKRNFQQTINTNWCFICSKGGNLICCETCPTSVHVECMPGDPNEDDTFFCEDCQSGRLPLYDEIVWVKLGTFRWWPALILFPNEVPDNVRNIAHNKGEFVVKFFGTYDHYWVGRGRTFLFQEGDKGHSNPIRKRVDSAFVKAIEEAAAAHQLKKRK